MTFGCAELQGTITDISPTIGHFLGSSSQDRYFRFHSTFPPPEIAGRNQEERGEILGSVFMKSIPTSVVADTSCRPSAGQKKGEADDGDGDRVWEDLEDVYSDEEDVERVSRRRKA